MRSWVLILGTHAACTGASKDPSESGVGFTDSGGTTTDSGEPDDDCEPTVLPGGSSLTPGETLLHGDLKGIELADGGTLIVVADDAGGRESGEIYAFEPGATEAVWEVSAPEAYRPLGIEATRRGEALVAIGRSDGDLPSRALEVREAATGELLSRITRSDGGLETLAHFDFADDRLAVGVVGDVAAVAAFASPWGDGTWDERAAAVHHDPSGACCVFGSVVSTAGDTDGDGLDDVIVMGGGAWLLDGEMLLVDEGVSEADAIAATTGFTSHDAIGAVGDIDGDGLDDFTSSTAANAGTWVQIIAGGSLREMAIIYSDDPDGYVGESVTGLGKLDGADTDTMAVVYTKDGDMATGGDEVWLVSGPLCGTYALADIGVEVEVPSTTWIYKIDGFDGAFAAIDYGVDGGYLYGRF